MLEQWILDHTQTDSVEDAINAVLLEREALGQTVDENLALKIINKKLLDAIAAAEPLIKAIQDKGTMFLDPSIRTLAERLHKALAPMDRQIILAKEIQEGKE